MEQTIISIGRQFGSGGHEIGQKLAEKLGIKFYDNTLIEEIAVEKGANPEELRKYEEKPKFFSVHRAVNGYSNSPHDAIANLEFDAIREKANKGESFVIVGRCADEVLKDAKGVIKLFISGNPGVKLSRVMEREGLSEKAALDLMEDKDSQRKNFHNTYSKKKWGHASTYDLCINSSHLGIDGTVDLIYSYISKRA